MDIADKHFPLNVKLALLALILCMKMSGFVFLVEHSNYNSREHGYDRHNGIMPDYCERPQRVHLCLASLMHSRVFPGRASAMLLKGFYIALAALC